MTNVLVGDPDFDSLRTVREPWGVWSFESLLSGHSDILGPRLLCFPAVGLLDFSGLCEVQQRKWQIVEVRRIASGPVSPAVGLKSPLALARVFFGHCP